MSSCAMRNTLCVTHETGGRCDQDGPARSPKAGGSRQAATFAAICLIDLAGSESAKVGCSLCFHMPDLCRQGKIYGKARSMECTTC